MHKNNTSIACSLTKCCAYENGLEDQIKILFETAALPFKYGDRVLVKPNLLTGMQLACTHPAVTAAACGALLDLGCKVEVADSPGFGSANSVAKAIGLDMALASLGLKVSPMDQPTPLRLDIPGKLENVIFKVSRRALECDHLFSLPKIKAHAQMRVTLAVKNCFGCVCGLRKALVHAREGSNPELFADCIAALWANLPPTSALADGIIAMNETGPIKGSPYPLHLLGASSSAEALDRAIMQILGVPEHLCPISQSLAKRNINGKNIDAICYPLLKPDDFSAPGFKTPASLAHTSFGPARLCKTMLRRTFAVLKGKLCKL